MSHEVVEQILKLWIIESWHMRSFKRGLYIYQSDIYAGLKLLNALDLV